ncbi:Uncharacterized conserved protein [Phocoenobacter uteri]|uniref:Uncharacterized conserved protein n=1 Tax=Phocoenobacter uteri TaxID=146806 RepID=A0A379C8K1_9PAST|nr:cupin domain-containing protein [Phocoenobacter uteri]MDG6882548.1 cupin [Phocoenobacter uteri]SUB58712.1 Uncharacterized conserved protein [Phocoenobacter uteri]
MDKEYWIQKLNLEPHQEGGYFAETYRGLSSNILFLLTNESPSHFHKLDSDETWFYHCGESLCVHMIDPKGNYSMIKMGLKEDEHLQYTVPAGTIFGSSVENDYALVSCTVSPAFSYEQFYLFTQKELLDKYPQHREIIKKLTRT